MKPFRFAKYFLLFFLLLSLLFSEIGISGTPKTQPKGTLNESLNSPVSKKVKNNTQKVKKKTKKKAAKTSLFQKKLIPKPKPLPKVKPSSSLSFPPSKSPAMPLRGVGSSSPPLPPPSVVPSSGGSSSAPPPLSAPPPPPAPPSPPAPPQPAIIFEDNFESNKGWTLFEEIVNQSSCYGSSVAEISRLADVAFEGLTSFRLWANKGRSTKSNHVIAQNKILPTGQNGIWKHEVRTYIPEVFHESGETGPELSIQNTRQISAGVFKTATAGIQYRANKYSPQAYTWGVWKELDSGGAAWHTFLTQKLEPGIWYTLTLEFDYNLNVYRSFSIQGGNINQNVDLSPFHIALESKFNEEAFWITLEAENLWNNCGDAGVFDYQVYFDNIQITKVTP
ncbi:MAG: hypothetical protein AAB588_05640 [Patescibacteria group bacterium]